MLFDDDDEPTEVTGPPRVLARLLPPPARPPTIPPVSRAERREMVAAVERDQLRKLAMR